MKRNTDLLYTALFAFLCSMFFLPSCSYDESFFKRQEKSICPEAQNLCDDVCVTLGTKEHCVECGDLCTFDRTCKGNVKDGYQCLCPPGMENCGKELGCSSLDGGKTNYKDNRCGSCNVFCARSELCEMGTCVCPITAGGFLEDASGKTLTGKELSAEYLRNIENCGGCGKACLGGTHCVLGQCTKTVCDYDECHFPLPDGREECQPCKQRCREVGAAMVEDQTPLITVTAYISDNSSLNKDNTSKDAYGELGSKGYEFKRATNCKCGENLCKQGAADRCDAAVCVCGVENDVCSAETTCTSQGCKKPCDDLNRACTGKAACNDKRCECSGAQTQEADPDSKIAHCIDGLVCGAGGKCYCPTFGGKDIECGVRGDRCDSGKCVCGALGKGCDRNTICKNGGCFCGLSEVCDPILGPNCVNDKCVCGTAKDSKACAANEKCTNGLCLCTNDDACTSINDKFSQANKCKDGKCVCGDTGGPCSGAKQCVGGRCLCTEDNDCSANETCDKASGQCSCGAAKACREGSSCTEQGYCNCKNGGKCNDSESCNSMGSFGNICVCADWAKQKSCRIGARCGYFWAARKCFASDSIACHTGETVNSDGFCVCGSSSEACKPGQTCKDGKCVNSSPVTSSQNPD